MIVEVPVSIGELVDKYTILNIKHERINDNEKLHYIQAEMDCLRYKLNLTRFPNKKEIMKSLKEVNEKLWDLEDAIRNKENKQEFDQEFIDIARDIYKTNDERFRYKTIINKSSGSVIREEKSH